MLVTLTLAVPENMTHEEIIDSVDILFQLGQSHIESFLEDENPNLAEKAMQLNLRHIDIG